jgi:hypothetical protein
VAYEHEGEFCVGEWLVAVREPDPTVERVRVGIRATVERVVRTCR